MTPEEPSDVWTTIAAWRQALRMIAKAKPGYIEEALGETDCSVCAWMQKVAEDALKGIFTFELDD